MELFLLALLAATAALSTDESKAALPKMLPPPPDPEPDYGQIRAKHLLDSIGYENVRHWNALQEANWLMDRFVCPEGHDATYTGDERRRQYRIFVLLSPAYYSIPVGYRESNGLPGHLFGEQCPSVGITELPSFIYLCKHPDHGYEGLIFTVPEHVRHELQRK